MKDPPPLVRAPFGPRSDGGASPTGLPCGPSRPLQPQTSVGLPRRCPLLRVSTSKRSTSLALLCIFSVLTLGNLSTFSGYSKTVPAIVMDTNSTSQQVVNKPSNDAATNNDKNDGKRSQSQPEAGAATISDGGGGASNNDEDAWDILEQFKKTNRGWNKRKTWNEDQTKVLRALELPKWPERQNGYLDSSSPNDESGVDNDRMGDVWLPPRLRLPGAKTLKYGVLFCGTGKMEEKNKIKTKYATRQMIPMIRYYREVLGVPDAKERDDLRKNNQGLPLSSKAVADQGFALVTSKEFIREGGLLYHAIPFFDVVYLEEDLPLYPFDWRNATSPENLVKATKVHAMASAPFDTTVMLDFDSFPCRADFALPLLKIFNRSDIGFTRLSGPLMNLTGPQQFLSERNSAIVVLNMTSVNTRMLLALYVQAFHLQNGLIPNRAQRDQPALMVALQAMAEEFQPNPNTPSEVPNDSIRHLLNKHQLGFIRYIDFDLSLVCRHRTSFEGGDSQCLEENACLVAHKISNLESVLESSTNITPNSSGGLCYSVC